MDPLTELANAARRPSNASPATPRPTLSYSTPHSPTRLSKLELMRCGFFFGIGSMGAFLAITLLLNLIGLAFAAGVIARLLR